VADTSSVGESANLLAEFGLRSHLTEAARQRAMRRTLAGGAVAVLHVLFVLVLLSSEWIQLDIERAPELKPLLWIPLLEAGKAPKPAQAKPNKNNQNAANSKIIPQHVIQPEEENNAIDLGLALGRSLACGANSYEYLNLRQQMACMHRPWMFVYDRYGNIVLYANQRLVEEQETLRPSDVQAHERNTAPSCPTNADPNAPCLSNIIGGHR
jgi:hypothetical protein